jgi:hypothetical protein
MFYLFTPMVYLTMLRLRCRIIGWLMNNEWEGMRKEGVVTSFEALIRHLPGKTEENTPNLS